MHIVKKSKGKFVVKKKTPIAIVAKTATSKGKPIRTLPEHPSQITAHQAPVTNNPTSPALPAATQPIAVAPKRPNPFRKAAGVAQQND